MINSGKRLKCIFQDIGPNQAAPASWDRQQKVLLKQSLLRMPGRVKHIQIELSWLIEI